MTSRIALLDVNVLIALFDGAHTHHEAAHDWFADNQGHGWATCPTVQNGFIRVLSNPAYPGRSTSLGDAIDRLRQFTATAGHAFWPDDRSILEPSLFDPTLARGHRQITDVYLLAIAAKNHGRLATFDRRISHTAVDGARACNLALLG